MVENAVIEFPPWLNVTNGKYIAAAVPAGISNRSRNGTVFPLGIVTAWPSVVEPGSVVVPSDERPRVICAVPVDDTLPALVSSTVMVTDLPAAMEAGRVLRMDADNLMVGGAMFTVVPLLTEVMSAFGSVTWETMVKLPSSAEGICFNGTVTTAERFGAMESLGVICAIRVASLSRPSGEA